MSLILITVKRHSVYGLAFCALCCLTVLVSDANDKGSAHDDYGRSGWGGGERERKGDNQRQTQGVMGGGGGGKKKKEGGRQRQKDKYRQIDKI